MVHLEIEYDFINFFGYILSWYLCNSQSDMSIIQQFSTNQIAANEIIIVMTPYCPTPQHLLHLDEGVNLLSLKTFVNQNILDTYIKSSWPYYLQWYEVGWKNIVVIWSSLFTNRHLVNNCTFLSSFDIKYLYWPKTVLIWNSIHNVVLHHFEI